MPFISSWVFVEIGVEPRPRSSVSSRAVDSGGVVAIGFCRHAGVFRSSLSRAILEARDLDAMDGVGPRSSAMMVGALDVVVGKSVYWKKESRE
jgi:hypothetical protein